MSEFAVFSFKVVEELVKLGFEVQGRTNKAAFFNDSEELREAINLILRKL